MESNAKYQKFTRSIDLWVLLGHYWHQPEYVSYSLTFWCLTNCRYIVFNIFPSPFRKKNQRRLIFNSKIKAVNNTISPFHMINFSLSLWSHDINNAKQFSDRLHFIKCKRSRWFLSYICIRTHLERIKNENIQRNRARVSANDRAMEPRICLHFRLSKCVFHLCCKCKLIIGFNWEEFEFYFG